MLVWTASAGAVYLLDVSPSSTKFGATLRAAVAPPFPSAAPVFAFMKFVLPRYAGTIPRRLAVAGVCGGPHPGEPGPAGAGDGPDRNAAEGRRDCPRHRDQIRRSRDGEPRAHPLEHAHDGGAALQPGRPRGGHPQRLPNRRRDQRPHLRRANDRRRSRHRDRAEPRHREGNRPRGCHEIQTEEGPQLDRREIRQCPQRGAAGERPAEDPRFVSQQGIQQRRGPIPGEPGRGGRERRRLFLGQRGRQGGAELHPFRGQRPRQGKGPSEGDEEHEAEDVLSRSSPRTDASIQSS